MTTLLSDYCVSVANPSIPLSLLRPYVLYAVGLDHGKF